MLISENELVSTVKQLILDNDLVCTMGFGSYNNNKETTPEFKYPIINISTPSGKFISSISVFNSYSNIYNYKVKEYITKKLKPINVVFYFDNDLFKLISDRISRYTTFYESRHRYKNIMPPVNKCFFYDYQTFKNGLIPNDIINTISTHIDNIKYAIKVRDTANHNEFSNSFYDNYIISEVVGLNELLINDFKIEQDKLSNIKFYTHEKYRYFSGNIYIYRPDIPFTIMVDPTIVYSSVNISDVTSRHFMVDISFNNINNKSTDLYGMITYDQFINFVETIHYKITPLTNISSLLNYWFKHTCTYNEMRYLNHGIVYTGIDKYGTERDPYLIDRHSLSSKINIKSEDITNISEDVKQLASIINEITTLFLNLKINNTID